MAVIVAVVVAVAVAVTVFKCNTFTIQQKSYNSISASYFCISFAAVTHEERPTIGSKEWLRELPISDEQDKYYVGVILYYITTTKGKLYDRA